MNVAIIFYTSSGVSCDLAWLQGLKVFNPTIMFSELFGIIIVDLLLPGKGYINVNFL